MKRFATIFLFMLVVLLSGCATSQKVTLAMNNPPKILNSASLVPQDGNNPDMNSEITQQFQARGTSIQAPAAVGTRQADNVDMLVTYTDVWRWDLVMYLKSLEMNIFDAKTGNMIVTGRWENSLFHGFQDSKQVIKELIDAMMGNVMVASSKSK